MIKAVALIGPLACLTLGAPAFASTGKCPSGQIFRVSLHTCASRSASAKYLHGEGAKHVARRTRTARADVAAPEPSVVAANPAPSAVSAYAPLEPAPPAVAPVPVSTPPSSPFGALPLPSSFH